MPIQFPNEADKIREIVRQRNIQWLVHFTHINNINSIVEHGILPRLETEQLNNNIGGNFVFPDPSRADRKNASCLSIMFPNSKMLWHKRQQYPDKDWVFLMLEPDILWECDCAFYPTNAASTGVTVSACEEF
ncbi:DarT ssDNA thymidine ADP-ribosyltransferase family protein [Kingella kingae]|uniref:DarT ssDNA thymidine ADP-ribosyltransferase family protein n=1 Tax=Kingella kingae TaxID=504 RepID=UPI0013E08BBE|nr:DarT ssDNA thymidine ADP-ribosyltransferase family protein [Kingella kingae]QIF40626.1 DUF4433 domain-containing protein [Kingella kingae]